MSIWLQEKTTCTIYTYHCDTVHSVSTIHMISYYIQIAITDLLYGNHSKDLMITIVLHIMTLTNLALWCSSITRRITTFYHIVSSISNSYKHRMHMHTVWIYDRIQLTILQTQPVLRGIVSPIYNFIYTTCIFIK